MKRYKTTVFTLLSLFIIGIISYFSFNAFNFEFDVASEQQLKYSQVRIFAVNDNDFKKMVDAGLIIDHANSKLGHFLDAWLSENEIDKLKK
jgi:hypothetical protein